MGLLTDLISKVGLDTKDFERDLDRAERQLVRKGRRMSLIGNDLTNNISLPLLAMGGYAIKAAADIERLELALKNTMGAGYIDELAKLKEAAKDPGLGFQQAVRGSVALQAVGESAETARDMLRQWGNAVAAAGGTADNLDRVVTQLQQALSKQGSLLREDWKFIIQQAPQAQKAMMQIYGTGSTEELAKQGVTAKQAITAITAELSKLGRVQGGIANQFINFRDELNQTLVPLGKMIFESASLREVMRSVIDNVTRVTKVFSNLSPAMQKAIVQFGAGLIVLGPLMRLAGSSILIWSQFYKNIAKVTNKMGGFTRMLIDADNSTGKWKRSMMDLNPKMTELTRKAVVAAGAIGALGAILASTFATVKIREIFASKMGELAANNPNSIWAKMFDPAFFQQFGSGASTAWVKGFAEQMAKNDRALKAGMEKWAKVGFNLWGIGAKEKQGLPPFVQWMQEKGGDVTQKISKWGEAIQDLNKELTRLDEMGKLLGENMKYAKMDAIMDAAAEGIMKFGKAADSPAIKGLVTKFRDLRGTVQGIVAEIPKLNLLPKSLEPTGGIPSSGADRVGQIGKDQSIWNEQTMYYRGLRSVQALNAGYSQGLITYGEAALALTNKYGLSLSAELGKGLNNGMVLQGQQLSNSLNQLAEDVKMNLSGGFADAIGSIVGGENPMKAFAQGLILPLAEVLKQFGELLIAAGTARESLSALAFTGVGAIIAGTGLIAASAAIKSFMNNKLTSLAEGGIAKRPTQALVGDNPRSPELITPLHKLPGLMRSVMGSGGGAVIRLLGNFEIQGDKLSYFIDEQLDLRKSLSMY